MSGVYKLFGSDVPVDFDIRYDPRACVVACLVVYWAEVCKAWVILGTAEFLLSVKRRIRFLYNYHIKALGEHKVEGGAM